MPPWLRKSGNAAFSGDPGSGKYDVVAAFLDLGCYFYDLFLHRLSILYKQKLDDRCQKTEVRLQKTDDR